MPGGRPLKYNNCLDLDIDCELYFEECTHDSEGELMPWKEWTPFTVTGLAIALNVDRKTITNYEKKGEFFPTIKKAKTKIENYLEQRLYGQAVTGVIFNLKNNFSWKDKQEQEITGKDGKSLYPAGIEIKFRGADRKKGGKEQ